MKEKMYNEIVKKYLPKENKLLNVVKAFVFGGLIGALGNLLIEFYSSVLNITKSESGVYMISTLIFFACLFTALGFFDKFVNFARMGAIIPITGFAHSMQSATLDYKNEGLIYGFGSNMFKLAGSVILYGVVSAYLFGLIRYLLGGII